MRGLLVYGFEPSGHASAASALYEAGRKAGLDFFPIDLSHHYHPLAGRAIARSYHGLLRVAPRSMRHLYCSRWSRQLLSVVRSSYLQFGGGKIKRSIARLKPDVIVCPQMTVAAVLSQAKKTRLLDVPIVSVLTDYGPHPFWSEPPADLIITPTDATCSQLSRMGVPLINMKTVGIPIDCAFSNPINKLSARKLLKLPEHSQVILLSGGSKGYGDIEQAIEAYLKECPKAILLVLCGINHRLKRAVTLKKQALERIRVFGFQPSTFVATLLAASDIHAGKPGGVTVAESLAVGLPMAMINDLTEQEEMNANYLWSIGAAIRGRNWIETARQSAKVLSQEWTLKLMCHRAKLAGRPRAAEQIIEEIINMYKHPKTLCHLTPFDLRLRMGVK